MNMTPRKGDMALLIDPDSDARGHVFYVTSDPHIGNLRCSETNQRIVGVLINDIEHPDLEVPPQFKSAAAETRHLIPIRDPGDADFAARKSELEAA